MPTKIVSAFFLILLSAGTAFAQPDVFLPAPPPTPAPVIPAQPAPEIGQQIDRFLDKDSRGAAGLSEGTSEKLIALNFKEVPIADAITVLSKQAGINITLDRDVPTNLTVTSVYAGSSVESALKSITAGMDLRHKKTPEGFLLLPWSEAYIDVNKVYQFGGGSSSTSAPFSGTNSQPQANATGGVGGVNTSTIIGTQPGQMGSSQVTLQDFGGYMDSLLSMIKPLLSKQGVVSYMPTGFIYVRDYPSRVKTIEEIFNVDNDKR
jgi:hypothetical protein